jgi:hypothetical protein
VPSGSQDELPPVEIVPGYSSSMADWAGKTVAFENHSFAFATDCEAFELTPTDALEPTMDGARRIYAGETLGS